MTRCKESKLEDFSQGLFVDGALLRNLVEKVVQEVLEAEVERHLNASHHERTNERRGYRNGSKPRKLKTSVGELNLQLPQVRESGFRTQAFERWQRSDKALVSAMQEMVVQGVSTRNVSQVMEELGGFSVSASRVSHAMNELDEQINAFFNRDLGEHEYPYLIIDARYEKVRLNGRVRSQAVLIAAGVNDLGQREFLGFAVGDSESEGSWGDLFRDLKRRKLRGVELVVSDAHRGIQSALTRHFQGVYWQRCKVHFLRELRHHSAKKHWSELLKDLQAIYASDERRQCLAVGAEVADKWDKRAPRMSRALRAGLEDTLTVWDLPNPLRRKLHSTNMMERLMKEIKKRTRNVGSFPNEKSCWRLVGALLLEIQDTWDTQHETYLNLDHLK